jgi:hypothetical protein
MWLRHEACERGIAYEMMLETFRWDPAGNQSCPAKPGQQPEASFAWCAGNWHCEA